MIKARSRWHLVASTSPVASHRTTTADAPTTTNPSPHRGPHRCGTVRGEQQAAATSPLQRIPPPSSHGGASANGRPSGRQTAWRSALALYWPTLRSVAMVAELECAPPCPCLERPTCPEQHPAPQTSPPGWFTKLQPFCAAPPNMPKGGYVFKSAPGTAPTPNGTHTRRKHCAGHVVSARWNHSLEAVGGWCGPYGGAVRRRLTDSHLTPRSSLRQSNAGHTTGSPLPPQRRANGTCGERIRPCRCKTGARIRPICPLLVRGCTGAYESNPQELCLPAPVSSPKRCPGTRAFA
jgi:hypothetical protein